MPVLEATEAPFEVTTQNFISEIRHFTTTKGLPVAFQECMRSLIHDAVYPMPGTFPEATAELIALFQQHMASGIKLHNNEYKPYALFDIGVVVPHDRNRQRMRPFFRLIRKYVIGDILPVKDIPENEYLQLVLDFE